MFLSRYKPLPVSVHRALHLLRYRALDVQQYYCMPGALHLQHPIKKSLAISFKLSRESRKHLTVQGDSHIGHSNPMNGYLKNYGIRSISEGVNGGWVLGLPANVLSPI